MMMSCTTGARVPARQEFVVHLQRAVVPAQGCALGHCQPQPRRKRSYVLITQFFSLAVLNCRRKKLWTHSVFKGMNECLIGTLWWQRVNINTLSVFYKRWNNTKSHDLPGKKA
ncbi:hypothetical protein Y032_0030g2149 [Ancylostoma ceylanicum]|uniref:Uncharacterized protein n=1 Tax=Ancylostoma ceylanicum TaxID=53326 RepID=A0A016USY5_9BILA|nr:hypothetical protein Y032_0030g2149 [Ancylostoma ceylanicum]